MPVRLARQSGRHNAVGRALILDKTIQGRKLLGGDIGSLPVLLAGRAPAHPDHPDHPSHPAKGPSPTDRSASPPPPQGGSSGGGSSGSPPPGPPPGSGGPPSGSGSNGGSSSGGGTSVAGGSGNLPPSTTVGTPPSPITESATSIGTSQPSNSASNPAGGSVSLVNGSSSTSGSTTQISGSQSTSSAGDGTAANAENYPDTVQSGIYTSPSSPSVVAGSQSSLSNGPLIGNGSSTLSNKNAHHISSGGIAAIVVVLLLFLFLIVFLLRRRSRLQRAERKNRWWFATNRTSQTYGDIATAGIMPAGTQTARSSFVTSVDHSESAHSQSAHPSLTYIIPPFPPAMAEMGRGNASRPALIINTQDDDNQPYNDVRFSIGSTGSGQYLFVHSRNSSDPQGGNTPMSVRPFSASESFAFPKPPEPAAGSVGGPSSATSAKFSVTSSNAGVSPPGIPVIPTIPLTTPPTPPAKGYPSPTATNMARPVDPFADNNPFEDSNAGPSIVYSTVGLSDIEVVRRPFVPTLPDELAVNPDDHVRVLQSFDDGWALVERASNGSERASQDSQRASQGSHGNGRQDAGSNRKGLIPIHCLREPGQELPAFTAPKRVSSCGEYFMAY
ncbi:hypothetical protein BYT27DRAFT_7342716 [Phlegmacium glaucopus]|nr:hypothetical protein BYT27DRAFT_7342716 [Phlegmacium glaucopus]